MSSEAQGSLSNTLEEMQRLNDGFQALADELLRHSYDFLRPLKPFGINHEGKPISGVPDSYVGESPSHCLIAVQHTTTQTSGLSAKFVSDYDDVVRRCSEVELVILCTNRPETRGVADAVRKKARADGRRIQVVWGEELARVLDQQRQDLRRDHLRIPLDRLTKASLVPTLAERVTQATSTYLGKDEVAALEQRVRRLPLESQFSRLRPSTRNGVTLIVGAAGLGKTTWSAATAIRLSRTVPVVWLLAKSVGAGGINSALVTAVYGTDGPERVHELAQVLRSSGRTLVAFVDAIDEHADYQQLQEALQTFEAQSYLAPATHLVLTCRDEAIETFKNVEPNTLPSESNREGGRHLVLGPLPEEQSLQLLRRLRTTQAEIAEIKSSLPERLFSNPLYLKLARKLQVARVSPKTDDWIESFANHFLRNIRSRLRSNPPLTDESASAGLEALAVPILRAPQGLDEAHALALLPSWGSTDRLKYLERAVQSGVLVRSDRRVRFCHSLFAEYFAAKFITNDTDKSDSEAIALISTLPGGPSIAQFAARVRSELLPVLARQHPHLMPEFDPSLIEQSSLNTLKSQALVLLNSKYPSERWAGVRILGRLGGGTAGHAAVAWFNELNASTRQNRHWEVSELFLQLQLPEAAVLVAHHPNFGMPIDFPWYELEFKNSLESASLAFKSALAAVARKGLETEGISQGEEVRFTMVLTYLTDNWLLEHLQAKAERGPLAGFEHRSLIMFNSDAATAAYSRSRTHYTIQLDSLSEANDPDGRKRTELWDRLVPSQGDILRFPCDALVRLAAGLLEADDRRDARFGMELADLLKHPALVDKYARARGGRGVFFGRDMISELVRGSDGPEIVSLYETCPSAEARCAILKAAGEVPGKEVEELLLNALAKEELFDAACVGLAKQRSPKAGSVLHERLRELTGYPAYLACNVLARCAFEPALEDLIKMLDAARDATEKDQWLSEYHLLRCIGQIGGVTAYDVLADSWGRGMDVEILAFLLDSHDAYALDKVRGLIAKFPEATCLLGKAIRRREGLREDVVYFSETPKPFEFTDSTLLAGLIKSATKRLEDAADSGLVRLELMDDCEAISLFDAPEAHTFLLDLAKRDTSRSSNVIATAVGFARRTLGQRGNRRMAKLCVQEKLQQLSDHDRYPRGTVERLAVWPRAVVRECLLEALDSVPERKAVWLQMLASFASAEDVRLFSESLEDLPAEVVDEILQRMPSVRNGDS